MQSPTTEQDMVLSYLAIRRFLGILGILLPLVLLIGGCLTDGSLRNSISDYYHSPNPLIHGFFIGIMCAIGVFLVCYKGHDSKDNWVASIAGIAAFGIAIFPAAQGDNKMVFMGIPYACIHYASAAVFLIALSIMSCCLFTKGKNKFPLENTIYRVCGGIIFLMVLVVAFILFRGVSSTIFWLESVAVWAFGISWLVKGNWLRRRAK